MLALKSEYIDRDSEITLMERALDTNFFNRMLDSGLTPVRAAATVVIVAHAFSKALNHPEYLPD
jgi:hypothetical protein